jgi:hypothetical protein
LLSIFLAILMARPGPVESTQSPAATPAATPQPTVFTSPLLTTESTRAATPALAAPAVSPLVWIAAGFVIGLLVVFFVQRRPPDDRQAS